MGMGDVENGAASDVQSVAAAMKAQAQETERLRMQPQCTSIKQKEDILEPTSGTVEEFV